MNAIELVNADVAIRRGKQLENFTVVWNSLEGLIAVGAGVIAGSISLVGFGFDSVIEVTSGIVIIWRLRHAHGAKDEASELTARRLVGLSFFALAAYVLFDSIKSLIAKERPHESLVGIILAALSVVIMPFVAWKKRQVASTLNSAAIHADSQQTQLCAYLSAILLGGLSLNAVLGWWWADPIAALVMVPIIVNEGVEAVRGDTCRCR